MTSRIASALAVAHQANEDAEEDAGAAGLAKAGATVMAARDRVFALVLNVVVVAFVEAARTYVALLQQLCAVPHSLLQPCARMGIYPTSLLVCFVSRTRCMYIHVWRRYGHQPAYWRQLRSFGQVVLLESLLSTRDAEAAAVEDLFLGTKMLRRVKLRVGIVDGPVSYTHLTLPTIYSV